MAEKAGRNKYQKIQAERFGVQLGKGNRMESEEFGAPF